MPGMNVDARRAADRQFLDFEFADLGELRGRDVVHLRCDAEAGTEAFVRRGARSAVGLDLPGATGTPLDGRRFDVAYVGKGALCHLADLDRFAGVLVRLLRPGATAYIVDYHPVALPEQGAGAGPAHGIGDVVTALLGAKLRITGLRDHDALPWRRWPQMTQDEWGWWRLPAGQPRVPLLYALRAMAPHHPEPGNGRGPCW